MIKTYEQAKYEVRQTAQLINWEHNPRTVTAGEFARLKKQIDYLGVYKPLLINQDNIVLGGNMRLKALREMDISEVMCAIVLTDNKAQMMEYALSDNDQAGITDEQQVAEYVALNPIQSEIFAINSTPMKLVSKINTELGPSDNTPQSEQKCRQCPEHCGMENI